MERRIPEWLLLAGIAVLALAAGIASGDYVLALAVALGLFAVRQVWIARRLARALRGKQRLEPPFPGGPWREIFTAVRSLQLRSRKRKRRLSRFVSRFQEAAAVLADGVVILGRENRIEWRNPAAAALLGLESRDCLGAPVAARVRDPVFVEYMAAGEFTRALEIRAPGNLAVMLSILVTPYGRRRQHVLVARDITRAYHLDQTRRDFIANVSHELRTPLTVLSGNLEMLGEDGVDERAVHTALGSMRENAERMRLLVRDLLTLSRLEMDRPEQGELPVDVTVLLESIVRDARVLASGSGHVVSLEAEPDLWIRGRESDLHSAFANLVNNAVRHTPPRTAVAVRWHGDDGGARLAVEDNGPGIPARHLSRLTERFYRVDASRSADTGGTGLGLAIVKHALDGHDATLNVESREGAGTVFECRFPVARLVDPDPG